MQSQTEANDKNYIAYLASLTLLFSYAEMLFPRILPFLKIGFSNIAVILALPLNISPFFMLLILKTTAGSLLQGTLFSPFFLLSFSQSLASGILMFMLFRLNKLCKEKVFSVYGISVCGSCISALVQIYLSSLYLGSSVIKLLGPVILFSVFSGIVTAFFSKLFSINKSFPLLKFESLQNADIKNADSKNAAIIENGATKNTAIKNAASTHTKNSASTHTKNSASTHTKNSASTHTKKSKNIICIFCVLTCAVFCMLIKNIYALTVVFILSIIFQKLCRRKFIFLIHLSLWSFILIAAFFVPQGKIIFSIKNITLTQGALLVAAEKALKLSAAAALSQTLASLRFSENTMLSLTVSYFEGIRFYFSSHKEGIIKKIRGILSAKELYVPQNKNNEAPFFIYLFAPVLFTAVFTVSHFL